MKKLYGLFISIFLYATSFAQSDTIALPNMNWIPVGSTVNNEKWYIKTEYVKKDEIGQITEWVEILIPKFKVHNKSYRNGVQKCLFIFNCSNKTTSLIEQIDYSSDGVGLDTQNFNHAEFINVVPESIMETVLQRVCDLFKEKN